MIQVTNRPPNRGNFTVSLFCYNVPTEIPAIGDAIEIATSYYNTCFLNEQRVLFCWGRTSVEEVLNCPNETQSYCTRLPIPVRDIGRVRSIDRDGALDEQGNVFGIAGNNFTLTAVQEVANYNFVSFSHTGKNGCGVTQAGEAFCWGSAESGQIGDGVLPFSAFPVRARF